MKFYEKYHANFSILSLAFFVLWEVASNLFNGLLSEFVSVICLLLALIFLLLYADGNVRARKMSWNQLFGIILILMLIWPVHSIKSFVTLIIYGVISLLIVLCEIYLIIKKR